MATARRARARLSKLTLLFAAGLVLASLATEAVFRCGIAIGCPTFLDPRLYAGWLDDDLQWQLSWRWQGTDTLAGRTDFLLHPLYGWISTRAADEDPPPPGPALLLYGDSFLFGSALLPRRQGVGRILQRRLPRWTVVDYSVSGYGLDQIFLRYRETAHRHREAAVVLSLMSLDLDRSILTVRDAPKPWFEVQQGRAVLGGVPLPQDAAAWHRAHPPRIGSYAWRFLRRRLQTSSGPETEIPYRQSEKRQINEAILESLAAHAGRSQQPLLVVILYPPWELGFTGWRETFLHQTLSRLGLPYLDTKALLLQAARMEGTSTDAFYYPAPDNHPNPRGNRLLAGAIVRWVRQRGTEEASE